MKKQIYCCILASCFIVLNCFLLIKLYKNHKLNHEIDLDSNYKELYLSHIESNKIEQSISGYEIENVFVSGKIKKNILLRDIIQDQTLIFLFPNTTCLTCYEKKLSGIFLLLDMIPHENLIILTQQESIRQYTLFVEDYKIENLNVYFSRSSYGSTFENVSGPILFVVDKNLVIQNPFLLHKEDDTANFSYVKTIVTKFFNKAK